MKDEVCEEFLEAIKETGKIEKEVFLNLDAPFFALFF